MAKIIGHYFGADGEYSSFVVNELQETTNLYVRTDETLSDAPAALDNWEALNKCHLGKLRPVSQNFFTMYTLQEDLPRFKEKVEAVLAFRHNIKMVTGGKGDDCNY